MIEYRQAKDLKKGETLFHLGKRLIINSIRELEDGRLELYTSAGTLIASKWEGFAVEVMQ